MDKLRLNLNKINSIEASGDVSYQKYRYASHDNDAHTDKKTQDSNIFESMFNASCDKFS